MLHQLSSVCKLIDSVQNLIVSNSKNTADKETSASFLIEKKLAKRIQESSIDTKESIIGSAISNRFSEDDLDLISPGEKGVYANESWDVDTFSQLPAFATIPILNKWKLENMKCLQILLNQIKTEIESQR